MIRAVIFSVFIFAANGFCAEVELPRISHEQNSPQWHKRNDHLIPLEQERAAILELNQDRRESNGGRTGKVSDIDRDGVPDSLDPSPFDWRETGYSPFGVLEFLNWNHTWNSFKYNDAGLRKVVKLIKAAGVEYVRVDFGWQDLEAGKGVWDFAKYDNMVQILSQNNIRILGVLSYSADWAGQTWNSPPRDDADFARYVSRVVGRYRDRVKYWEIWNEPDSPDYWKPQDEMVRYTRLLKRSYLAAKDADPSCKILLGGLTNGGCFALQNVYRNGGKDYFDIVNFHPFVNPFDSDCLDMIKIYYRNLKKIMAKYGDADKKIWFTEIGCPGVDKPRGQSAHWWEGRSPDEKQQAEFVEKVYTQLWDLEDVDKIFWAFFRDNQDHFYSGVDHFGLIRWDFSPKPGYQSYKRARAAWQASQRVSTAEK